MDGFTLAGMGPLGSLDTGTHNQACCLVTLRTYPLCASPWQHAECDTRWHSPLNKVQTENNYHCAIIQVLHECNSPAIFFLERQVCLGPLYTMAKDCDHDIVRARLKHIQRLYHGQLEWNFCMVVGLHV